jgi:hypothetical protein
MFDKAFIVGAGGTGGYLIPPLAKLLLKHPLTKNIAITIIDGDKFEEKNTARQFMVTDNIGQNKAEAMVETCSKMGMNGLFSIDEYIRTSSFVPFLEESSAPLIIAAVDNDATRAHIIDAIGMACKEKDFFFLTPGNSDGLEKVTGQNMWYGRINGEDYGVNPKLAAPNIREPQDTIPVAGSCALLQESRPQLIAANFMAASRALAVIDNLLAGVLEPKLSADFFDVRNMKTIAT